MKRTVRTASILVVALLLFAAFRTQDDLFELRKNFEIFGALYEEIAINYVDDVRPQPFLRSGIDAMLAQLDPYTHFYDEADMVDMQLMQRRKVGTVGLNVGQRGNRLTVLAPENNADAYKQCIRTGDILIQIGETLTGELSVEEAYDLLMGQPGTTIDVQVKRGSEPGIRTFVLPRTLPKTQNVSYSGYLGPDSTAGMAYVRLDKFGPRAAREVKRAFRNMNRDVPLKGMILDLRSNPGGIVSEAVDIVELFVPSGSVVVSTRNKFDSAVQELRTDEDPLFPETPLIVLMDRYSASASEIVAGALQDLDRAVILGETSFGKGLVQITRPLPHNSLLKLTISHYYLPTGRTIQSFDVNSASARVATPTATAFTTLGGRAVRGGFGVEPDEAHRLPDPSEIESVLLQESAFFLFANTWVNDRCALGLSCLDSDSDLFDSFRAWLRDSNTSLSTHSDLLVSQLEEEAQTQGYALSAQIVELKNELQQQKYQQLASERDRILERIKREVRTRLQTEMERIQLEIQLDPLVGRGIELLENRAAIEAILR